MMKLLGSTGVMGGLEVASLVRFIVIKGTQRVENMYEY